jgi:hypothetical protein
MGARNREGIGLSYRPASAGIVKLLRSPGIYSNEPIPPAFVAWRAGPTTLFLFGSIDCSKIPVLSPEKLWEQIIN